MTIKQKSYLPWVGILIEGKSWKKINANASFSQKFEAGIAIGVSYDISEIFVFEVRYNYGFNDFYQTDAVGLRRSEINGANRVFQMGLNYYLLLTIHLKQKSIFEKPYILFSSTN